MKSTNLPDPEQNPCPSTDDGKAELRTTVSQTQQGSSASEDSREAELAKAKTERQKLMEEAIALMKNATPITPEEKAEDIYINVK